MSYVKKTTHVLYGAFIAFAVVVLCIHGLGATAGLVLLAYLMGLRVGDMK